MPLNKEQFQQIQDALLDGYNEFNLRQMVRLRLGEALDRIAGGSNLEERVFNLVEWADRTGRERELVEEAYSYNPTNPALQELHAAWFVLQPVKDISAASDENPPQIFLSYSRKDSAQMQQVLMLLERAGLSVWTDEGLEPGTERWQSAIEKAIHRTECTVVLLSPDAKQSRWVGIEVSFAQALGRRIFPVLLRGIQVDSVPLSLFDAQYLDARQNLADAVSQRLLPALRRHLNLIGTASSIEPIADLVSAKQAVSESSERAVQKPVQKPAKEEPAEVPVEQSPVYQENRQVEEVSNVVVEGSPTSAPNKSPEKSRPRESLPARTWQQQKSVLYTVGIVLLMGFGIAMGRNLWQPPPQEVAQARLVLSPLETSATQATNESTSETALVFTPTPTLVVTPEQLPTTANESMSETALAFTPIPTLVVTPEQLPTTVNESTSETALAFTPTPTPVVTPDQPPTTANAGDTWQNPIDQAIYVYVPEGEFTMGSESGLDSETPVHTVYVDGFWIMRTEVTNAQYGVCVETGPCTEPTNSRWNDPEYADHPVTAVDWYQANQYAQWAGGRLPTEAEWEKACRGTEAQTYPWGDRAPTADLLNFSDSNIGNSTPVGSYPNGASPYGALDMAGNVWEWTSSGYYLYPYDPRDVREDPDTGARRVLRGGSFSLNRQYVRCAFRDDVGPDSRGSAIGLRVLSPGS